uniref:Uncharacterized protein n=1 Tax=Rhizophora mucronata TaxID=61149 RepID=A0A2P2R2L2_RHIMU
MALFTDLVERNSWFNCDKRKV